MPRFVRPAWLEADADGRASPVGLGPRDRDGWLVARLTLRTPAGEVSDTIRIDAGGRRGDGGAWAEITVPPSFTVEDRPAADGTHRITILAR